MRNFLVIYLLTIFVTTAAYAVKVTNLYEGTVPVASQSVHDRIQALPDALAQVFKKLSGDTASDLSSVPPSIPNAERYVEEYSYLPTAADPAYPYLLTVRFDRNAVNKLAKEAGSTLLGENRPITLVWLAITTNMDPPDIVENDSGNKVFSLLKLNAERAGLPLIFPVMDMTEMNKISVDDITALSIPNLKPASARYSPDAILVGRVSGNGDNWQSHWKLSRSGSEWDWTIIGKDEKEIVNKLLNNMGQVLMQKYAGSAEKKKQKIATVVLQVMGITQSEDLNSILGGIKQLSAVDQVEVMQVTGEGVWLEVRWRNTIDNLQQNIELNPHLFLQAQEGNKLVYEWVN